MVCFLPLYFTSLPSSADAYRTCSKHLDYVAGASWKIKFFQLCTCNLQNNCLIFIIRAIEILNLISHPSVLVLVDSSALNFTF